MTCKTANSHEVNKKLSYRYPGQRASNDRKVLENVDFQSFLLIRDVFGTLENGANIII